MGMFTDMVYGTLCCFISSFEHRAFLLYDLSSDTLPLKICYTLIILQDSSLTSAMSNRKRPLFWVNPPLSWILFSDGLDGKIGRIANTPINKTGIVHGKVAKYPSDPFSYGYGMVLKTCG